MEAARPSLEPLPDLPSEEPAALVPTPRAAASAAPASGPQPPPVASPAADADTTQTLEFIDPELLLAPADTLAAKPAPEPPAQVLLEIDPQAPLELAVEEPPRPPAAAAAAPLPDPAADLLALTPERTPASKPGPARPGVPPVVHAARAPSEATPVLVPLAKRASLSAAAAKLAAAAASQQQGASPAKAAPPVNPSATPEKSTPPPPPAVRPAKPAASRAAEAPSLAAWASARAAAAPPPAKTGPGRAMHPGAPPAKAATPPAVSTPKRPAPPPASAPAAAAPVVAAPASAPMDRDFIARNQVVERYLSGRLPLKAATGFERYCREHPQLLDEIGLPERVNAGLRLLEASGKPEPWEEAARPVWQRPQVTLGLAGAVALLAVTLGIVAGFSASKSHRIAELERAAHDRTLDAATSTREIRLLPSRSGASNAPAITIGGGRDAQLVDFRIDESRSPYRVFRVTIDRIDQGRVMVLDNLSKDSNGHLRIALNSTALGPGNYQLTIEGLTMRLEPQPDSWVTIGVVR
ncbi:MAG TPA: hypothetical protein VFK87_03670 [Steroidobacteraceae bacterium]|nr:hypothetical protein [Steroidobacteraceae bacterium]